MIRFLKYIGIAIVCLVIAAVCFALLYRKYLQHKFAEQRAIHSPTGIDDLRNVQIGGIDQWIEVRGDNVNNPILLFLHGGPGVAFIPVSGLFQGGWEKNFTVVQWDQRGAGKTYESNDLELQRKTMNVHQMEQDTLEVVDYLRTRFHKDKIFVVGHSWGSVLGLWMAHEHPELIYAYVGVGQIINIEQNADVMYNDDLQRARELHNAEAVKQLESVDSDHSPDAEIHKFIVANQWAGRFLGPPSNDSTPVGSILSAVISAPEYSLADDYGFIHAMGFSRDIFLPQLMNLDLTQLGTNFRVPVFFFEGRYDPFCRPSLIWQYSQTISAPRVGFVWFERSGHFPFLEEQQKFSDELAKQVLPLAQ